MYKKEPKKEYKDGEVSRLKKRIKKLEKENYRLKSELNAYEQAFKKTTKFLKDHTDEISLEDLIEAAKQDKSLKEVEEKVKDSNKCPKCGSEVKKLPTSIIGTIITCTSCNYRSVKKGKI